jgi:hypothetical protein
MGDESHRIAKMDERNLQEELVRTRDEEERLEKELEVLHVREEKIEVNLEGETHRPHRRRFFLVFIINGEDFKVDTHADELLKAAVEKALIESGNTGRRSPKEWEVRDAAGILLEMARDIKSLGLADGARLFLSLKVGAGGADAHRY